MSKLDHSSYNIHLTLKCSGECEKDIDHYRDRVRNQKNNIKIFKKREADCNQEVLVLRARADSLALRCMKKDKIKI